MATMDARVGSLPQPYPSLPASPTLTNPDMILPDYDLALSPGLDDEDRPARSQSPLMMWKNAHAATSSTDLQQLFSGSQEHHHAFPAGPITPTTPIIYGNGTMLSDIGEVTEAESTPGRPSPASARRRGAGGAGDAFGASPTNSRSPSPTPLPHNLRHQFHHNHLALSSRDNLGSDTPRRSSPTMGADEGSASNGVGVRQRARQQQQQAAQDRTRRDSIESNSTITTEDQAGLFADFDDAVSVGDSVFQGDDEESVAESYVEETYATRQLPIASATASSSLLAVPEFSGGGGSSSGGNTSDEGERRLSAASLSLRAEQILANAKKRLTTMEGNLNRARSSLYITSPSAGSLPSDGSTPSPRTPIRSATASSRYHDPAPGSPLHSRIASDGSLPNNDILPSNFPQRSASALGAAGGYRQPTASFKDADRIDEIQDSLSGGYHRAGLNRPVDIVLERLDEVEASGDTDILPSEARSSAQLENFLSPTFGSFNDSGEKGLTRSASVAQMRNLKDQMTGLKGKISTLREQARADSLKRRSLQSLRTPSPFTHSQVDQWYAEPQPQQSSAEQSPQSAPDGNNGDGRGFWNGEQASADDAQAIRHDAQEAMIDRNVVTPPAQLNTNGVLPGSACLPSSGSSGSRSSALHRSERSTPTQLDADRADQDSLISKYDYPEDGMATQLTYSSGPSKQATDFDESRALGDARSSLLPYETPPTEVGSSDGARTEAGENGDLSDDGEAKLLEDVFVDNNKTPTEGQQQTLDEDAYQTNEYESDQFGGSHPEEEYEDVDGYESESGESLYHEALQHPISHEDREDAFDYEHFILHSALGTISQQRLANHARSGSFSSEDSVETTRGPIYADENGNTASDAYPSPTRRTSMSSINTVESADSVDSFATATEGRTSRTSRTSRSNRLSSGSEGAVLIASHASRTAILAASDRPDSLLLSRSAASAAAASTDSLVSNVSCASATSTASKRNSIEEPRQTQKPQMARRPASSAAIPHHRPSVSSFESTGTTRSFPLVNRNRIGSLSAIGGHTGSANSIGAASNYRGASGGSSSSGSHSLSSSVSETGSAPTPTAATYVPDHGQGSSRGHSLSRSRVSSDNEELRSISESLMNETASICEQEHQQQQSHATGNTDVSAYSNSPNLDRKRSNISNPERSGSARSVRNGDGGSGLAKASQAQALQTLSKEDQYLVERLVGNLGRCVLGLSENGRASAESRAFRRRIDAARRILEGLEPV